MESFKFEEKLETCVFVNEAGSVVIEQLDDSGHAQYLIIHSRSRCLDLAEAIRKVALTNCSVQEARELGEAAEDRG